MGLLKKLFGEDERTQRLKVSRDTLRDFLKKVGRKRNKSTIKKDSDSFLLSEDTLNQAGSICYPLMENVCPRYEQIAGQATPKNLVHKKERDDIVCETAEAFSNYVEFFLAYQGVEKQELGMLSREMPSYPQDQGKYTPRDKLDIFEELPLPAGSDMDNLKNYSFTTSCKYIEGYLSSFVGSLNHSGIVQEILNTPGQLDALEEFITGIGRELSEKSAKLDEYQKLRVKVYGDRQKNLLNGEKEKSKKLAENLNIITSELGELTKRYENEKQGLIEMGIDESNIPASIIVNAREIGYFKSENGKYKTERVKQEEEEMKRLREEKRRKGLASSTHQDDSKQKTEYIDQESFFRQTRAHKKPTNITKIIGTDSSSLWGDKKEE